jgi:tRNA G10  N-methylase Trm11
MVKYFFVLGRNRRLSRSELFLYLNDRGINFKEVIFASGFVILDFPDKESIDLNVQEFGGIIKIGKVLFEGNLDEFDDYIKKEDLIPSDKFSYSVFGNVEENIFSQKFKSERRKAVLKHGRRLLQAQQADPVSLPKADYVMFVFEDDRYFSGVNHIYYGLMEQDYSFNEVKERDMRKPVRREELAISPRLSKIMINLSGAKKGELLLDGFCGIGGILIEALIKGINVYGVDKDKQAIENCRENIKWVVKRYNLDASSKIVHGDSKALKNIKFNTLVSETSLGELLKKRISDSMAREYISKFEKNIIPILRNLKNLKKSSDSRMVLTFPVVREVHVDIDLICNKTGLRLFEYKDIEFPIKEYRKDQFVSRDIVVFV